MKVKVDGVRNLNVGISDCLIEYSQGRHPDSERSCKRRDFAVVQLETRMSQRDDVWVNMQLSVVDFPQDPLLVIQSVLVLLP